MSELLKDFPAGENNEEFLESIGRPPEDFFDMLRDRIVSEPPNQEMVSPESIEQSFLEEFSEIAFSMDKKNRERLYDMYRGAYLYFAHHWRHSKKDEPETVSEKKFSISLTKTRKRKATKKED